jgi:hypothetical protein
MIIIAISHGLTCDAPYTRTYSVRPQDMPVTSVSNLLSFLDQQSNIESSHIDELMVIFDDSVQVHYTSDDIDNIFEEVDEDELEEYTKVA